MMTFSDIVELVAFATVACAVGGLANVFAGLLTLGVLLVVVARGLDDRPLPVPRIPRLRRRRARPDEDDTE